MRSSISKRLGTPRISILLSSSHICPVLCSRLPEEMILLWVIHQDSRWLTLCWLVYVKLTGTNIDKLHTYYVYEWSSIVWYLPKVIRLDEKHNTYFLVCSECELLTHSKNLLLTFWEELQGGIGSLTGLRGWSNEFHVRAMDQPL